jgi:hypothetical protein
MRWALLLALCLAAATGCRAVRAVRQFDPNHKWTPADGDIVQQAENNRSVYEEDLKSWSKK